MTQSASQKYQTISWKDYNNALKKRGSMLIWIDKDMAWNGTPTGKGLKTKKPASFSTC